MDFYTMKRKELQAMCKKHRIPANLSNLEMAKRLTELFKEKENLLVQGQHENASESESTNVVMNRKVKKVRFSPEHELIEFTRSRQIKRRTRRNSVLNKNSSSSVENVESGVDGGEMNENVDIQGRATRSRGLKLTEGQVNEKKRKGVKCRNQKNNVSTAENVDNGELKEGDVDSPGRVLRFRGKKLVEGVKNARERGKAKDDDEREKESRDDVNDEKIIEEIVDSPVRFTRARRQKLPEASVREKKIGRKVAETSDNVPLVSGEADDNRVITRRSFRNRGVVSEARGSGECVKSNGKGGEEVLENNKIAEVHEMVEPQILLRRSKRNANTVGDSQIINDDTRKRENGGIKDSRKTAKLLAVDDSGVDTESTGSKVDTDGIVLQIEEPIKREVRRSNGRNNVTASHEKGGNGEPLIAGGVSKNEEVPKPTGVMRRPRRKTSTLNLVASDEKFDTDTAVENCETEKHIIKPCPVEKRSSAVQKNTRRSRRNASDYKSLEILDELGGDSIIEKENGARKRKRGPISGDVVKTNNNPSSLRQPMKESKREEAEPGAPISKVVDERKSPSSLKEPNMLDTSPKKCLLRIGESTLFVETQMSVSEGAESTINPGMSGDTSNKNIVSDVGLVSSRKAQRVKQDVSIADGAGSADAKFINGNEMANSDENAASRIVGLKTESTDFEKEISASNTMDVGKVDSSLEFHVQELIGQNMTNMDKNHFEAQTFSQSKDPSRDNTIDNQILPEGSNVSRNEGFAETRASADSLLLADLEVTEAEADTQASPDAVDHVSEVEGISDQENLDSVETEQANVISSSIACHHNYVDHMEASNNISDDNNEDISSKAGEVGASESCERHIDSADTESALQLKEPSSGKLRSTEGDDTDEGDETYSHKGICSELAETEKGGSLKDHEIASNEDGEFSVPDLFDGETSARITPHDRGIISGEYSAMKSDKGGLEADHIGERDETFIDKSTHPEVAEIDEGGSSKCHKSKCQEDWESIVSNIFDAESRDTIMPQDREIFSGENSIKDFDGQEMFHDSPSVAPTTTCNSAKIKSRSGHEADQIAEGDETNVCKYDQSQLAETEEGGCLNNYKDTKDVDWEFSVSNLFDGEKSATITTYDRGFFSAEDLVKEFNEQVMHPDVPVEPTTCNEVEIGAGSSSLKERSPSKPDSVSKSQGTRPMISDVREITDYEAGPAATVQEKEVAMFQNNIPGDEMSLDKNISVDDHEVFNHADEYGNEYTQEQAEQPKSPLAKPAATENTIQGQEAWSNASETTGHAMCMFETNGKGIASQVVKGSNTDEDGNVANCSKDKDEFADACIVDVESFSKLKFYHMEGTEYRSKNLHERHTVSDAGEEPTDVESRQSWTELELRNLFEATIYDVTPTGLNGTSSQGNDKANLAMYMNKLVADSGNSLTKKKEKEVEGERGSESAKTTNKNVVLPTNYNEVFETGSIVDSEDVENQLKLLFETPIKILAPSKVDETSSHDKKLDRVGMSTTKCVGITEANAVTEIKPEKVRDAEHELENGLCLGNSSDNGDEVIYEELSEVKSVELDRVGMSITECVGITEENAVTEIKSDEKVQDAEHELENGLCLGNSSDNGDEVIYEELNEVESVDLDRVGMSITECVGIIEENAVTEIKSDENVQDTEHELENGLCLGNSSDNGEEVIYEDLNEAESVELANTSITLTVLSEASEEKLTENSCECLKESEESIIPLGQSCLYEEAIDNDSELKEKNAISSSCSPRNLSKLEGCQDMLIDTTLPENLSCGNKAYLKSEGETEQSSETAFELSDADTQQKSNVLENSDRLTACNEGGNILRESLVDTSSGPLDAEAANIGSFNGEKDVMDKGASPSPFSKASNDNDVVTERKGETREDDDPYGAKIWDEKDDSTRSFHVISDELHCNSEVAIFPSTCKETKETGTSIQNVDNILRTAECGFSVCGAEFDVISGLAMNLLPGDNENGDFDKSEAGTTVFSLEGDHETIDKQFEENSTAAIVQFSVSELHFEEKINDVPASGCNEILKESDVADTIKEYIDSESSLSVDFEESHASLSINVSAQTDERNTHENDALREFEEDFDARLVNPEVEDGVQSVECLGTESKEQEEATCVDLLVKGSAADKPSVETKVEEQTEEMMFKESNVGSKTVHSPACVDLVGNSGCAVNDAVISEEEEFESEDGHISSSRPLCSTAKKNARTILIHGTPSKVLAMADMKENAPKNKSSNIGDFTTMRPPKRKALQDVQWK